MEQLQVFKGRELRFTLPSGKEITIREQSAADDDIITSNNRNDNPLENLNRFIMAITTQFNGKNNITMDEVLGLGLRDKYFILLKTRIHSIGETLDFKYNCSCGCESEWTENLLDFDRDFSNPEDPNAGPKAPLPYPQGANGFFEITLSSGKKFRMKYLDGYGENFVLRALKNNTLAKSMELFSRELHWLPETGEPVKVSSLNAFSKKEGIELSKAVNNIDPQFLMGSEIICPNCQKEEFVSLIGIPDFFFPAGI